MIVEEKYVYIWVNCAARKASTVGSTIVIEFEMNIDSRRRHGKAEDDINVLHTESTGWLIIEVARFCGS